MDSVLPIGEFILAFAAFLVSHWLPTRPQMRSMLTRRLGARGFLLFSIAGRRVMDRRCRDRMGERWQALAGAVAVAHLAAALFPPGPTLMRGILAFALLGLVLLLHPLLFGVDPLESCFLP